MKENDLENSVYFHESDEPRPHHLEYYEKANNLVREYLSDYPIIDALSDFEFYQKGIVKKPIPSSNHIEPFLERSEERRVGKECRCQCGSPHEKKDENE